MGASLDLIMDALFARAALMETAGPELPVSFPEPGVAFQPPADGKYLRVDLFPNAPAWEGISDGRMDQGLLQVTVVWPKNLGLVAPGAVARKVIAHFPKGAEYFSGGTKVSITAEGWASAPLPEPDKVSIPVTIAWRA